ncbi:hypothetical protein RGU12_11720 [Fredinandcohnia sp. QZ13]|uniref:hypothetical protein n=1 Tax=Fredinandcohnia sp. QZ13 TaxID=3073144 RepID=UPI0028530C10|nr:hypothetical protein [Fredinandcohnia sp. QZ13]MDR4888220.1 hypothetical protein [Fredinandcohnia sp. QZ13]
MFKYFSFIKKQKEKQINPLLLTKLDRIIELLEQKEQKEKGSEAKSIQIDHVQIDHLENLTFQLDNLDIDELSGKLMIGNNIMSKGDLSESLNLKVNSNLMKKESLSETSAPKEEIVKTSKGYRFRNDL